MKKKTIKRLRLKESVKNEILAFVGCTALLLILIVAYTNRVNAINNNPEGYTESGRAHSINVQLTR